MVNTGDHAHDELKEQILETLESRLATTRLTGGQHQDQLLLLSVVGELRICSVRTKESDVVLESARHVSWTCRKPVMYPMAVRTLVE